MSLEVTKTTFDTEVINSDVPVLVDFWAPWCGPCKMVAPVLDQIGTDFAGKVKICKVNVDDEGELAQSHGVSSIPTMVVYNKGAQVRTSIGALPRPQIENLFKDLI